jgi:Domain of unknown function (DUF2382)
MRSCSAKRCRSWRSERFPRSRLRLGTQTVTDETEISEEVRKERIEPDGESLS